MRTTLTLEEDVATELQELARLRNKSFKQIVNDVLRAGLVAIQDRPRPRRRKYRTKPVSIGRCLVPSLDNIGDILAYLDDHERQRP